MKYIVKDNEIEMRLPSKNKGKFRYKNRIGLNEFGQSHATTSKSYKNSTYLEWQVGYDVKTNEIDKKPTNLIHLEFLGSNRSMKHPYELSELLYEAIKLGMITEQQIINLKDQVESFTDFFEEDFQITVLSLEDYDYNGYSFSRGDITLPSFFFMKTAEITIEISIQKQQYATGIQPMVYISIPVIQFKENVIGKTGHDFEYLSFSINDGNVDFIIDSFLIFGMCSQRHKEDVVNILNVISEDLF